MSCIAWIIYDRIIKYLCVHVCLWSCVRMSVCVCVCNTIVHSARHPCTSMCACIIHNVCWPQSVQCVVPPYMSSGNSIKAACFSSLKHVNIHDLYVPSNDAAAVNVSRYDLPHTHTHIQTNTCTCGLYCWLGAIHTSHTVQLKICCG